MHSETRDKWLKFILSIQGEIKKENVSEREREREREREKRVREKGRG